MDRESPYNHLEDNHQPANNGANNAMNDNVANNHEADDQVNNHQDIYHENNYEGSQTLAMSIIQNRILKDLNSYELSQLAQVDSQWNAGVNEEYKKRKNVEFKVFPCISDSKISNPSYHPMEEINVRPEVTLLFSGLCGHEKISGAESFDLITYDYYQKHFVNKVVVIGTHKLALDRKTIMNVPMSDRERITETFSASGVLGLCIPTSENVKIKQYHVHRSDYFCCISDIEDAIQDKLLDSLLPEEMKMKSILLLFTNLPDEGSSEMIMFKLSQKCISRNIKFWGFATKRSIFITKGRSCSVRNPTATANPLLHYAINLHGENLESWSAIIDSRHNIAKINQEINNLKEQVTLKKYAFGLVTAPIRVFRQHELCGYENSDELMNIIKTIFPDIPFLGNFLDTDGQYFGTRLKVNKEDKVFSISMDNISILIITYD